MSSVRNSVCLSLSRLFQECTTESKNRSCDWMSDFGWSAVNFPPSNWNRAMFWIFVEHRVDNIEVFLSFLSRAYTEPRPLLLFCFSCCQGSWGCMGSWEETQLEKLAQTDQMIWYHALCRKWGEEGGSGGMFGVMLLVFPSHCYIWWGPAILEIAEPLTAYGKP